VGPVMSRPLNRGCLNMGSLFLPVFTAMTLAFPALAGDFVPLRGGAPALMEATLTFSGRPEETLEKERSHSAPSKKVVPDECENKVCRIRVNGFSDSGYVYGQVELNRANKQVKGFVYKPGKQVYVYGQEVKGQAFLFLLKDARGGLYRLSPVENGRVSSKK